MKKILGFRAVCVLLGMILSFTAIGVVSAKYLVDLKPRQKELTAPNIYFRSNVMTETANPAPISIKGNKTVVTLANGIGESQFSDVNIEYELRYYVEKDGDWVLVRTETEKTMEKDMFSSAQLELEPIEYQSVLYTKIKLEAICTQPFEKYLCVCIDFDCAPWSVVYSYDPESYVITALLQTNVDEGEFTINWIEGVSPDNADENEILNEGVVGPSNVTKLLPSNHAYLLKFFVTDAALHTNICNAVDQNAFLATVVPIEK